MWLGAFDFGATRAEVPLIMVGPGNISLYYLKQVFMMWPGKEVTIFQVQVGFQISI